MSAADRQASFDKVRRFIEAAYSRDVTPEECEDAMIALNEIEDAASLWSHARLTRGTE